MPDDLLGPRVVGEDVLAAETVNTRSLRELAALAREDALPGIEEHLATGVDHWQVVVLDLYNAVQVLDAVVDRAERQEWITIEAKWRGGHRKPTEKTGTHGMCPRVLPVSLLDSTGGRRLAFPSYHQSRARSARPFGAKMGSRT